MAFTSSVGMVRRKKILGMVCLKVIVNVNVVTVTVTKQKHLGCKKSARPIRSNIQAGRCDQKL